MPTKEPPLAFIANYTGGTNLFLFVKNKTGDTYLCHNLTENRVGNPELGSSTAYSYWADADTRIDLHIIPKRIEK